MPRTNRGIIGVALFAFTGCLIMSVCGAVREGDLSLAQVTRRLFGLEERVARLEKEIVGLRQAIDSRAAEKPVIEITSPSDKDEVGMEVMVEGIVRVDDLDDRRPVVLVHPLLTNLIWVQQLPLQPDRLEGGFKFRCRVFLGTKEKGIGERFELRALLAKKGSLHEGDVLEKLPAGIPVSTSVLLTRVRD